MSIALKLAKRLAQNSPSKYVAAKTYHFYVNAQELEPPLDEPTGDKPQSSLPTVRIGLATAYLAAVLQGTFEQIAQQLKSKYPTARRVCVDAYDWLPEGPYEDANVQQFVKQTKDLATKESKMGQMHQLKDALMHAGFRVKIET